MLNAVPRDGSPFDPKDVLFSYQLREVWCTIERPSIVLCARLGSSKHWHESKMKHNNYSLLVLVHRQKTTMLEHSRLREGERVWRETMATSTMRSDLHTKKATPTDSTVGFKQEMGANFLGKAQLNTQVNWMLTATPCSGTQKKRSDDLRDLSLDFLTDEITVVSR